MHWVLFLFGLKALEYRIRFTLVTFSIYLFAFYRPRKCGDTEKLFAEKYREIVFHAYVVSHEVGAG